MLDACMSAAYPTHFVCRGHLKSWKQFGQVLSSHLGSSWLFVMIFNVLLQLDNVSSLKLYISKCWAMSLRQHHSTSLSLSILQPTSSLEATACQCLATYNLLIKFSPIPSITVLYPSAWHPLSSFQSAACIYHPSLRPSFLFGDLHPLPPPSLTPSFAFLLIRCVWALGARCSFHFCMVCWFIVAFNPPRQWKYTVQILFPKPTPPLPSL